MEKEKDFEDKNKKRKEWIEKIYSELKKAEETHGRFYVCCYFITKDDEGLEKRDIIMEGADGTHEEFIGLLTLTVDDLISYNEGEKIFTNKWR